MARKKSTGSWLRSLVDPEPRDDRAKDKPEQVTLQPALRQIGVTDCPVCKHEVAVFLTKNSRPFINCGFCSARIYNGQESMRLLRKKMKPVKD